jgi:hypothetical protein
MCYSTKQGISAAEARRSTGFNVPGQFAESQDRTCDVERQTALRGARADPRTTRMHAIGTAMFREWAACDALDSKILAIVVYAETISTLDRTADYLCSLAC